MQKKTRNDLRCDISVGGFWTNKLSKNQNPSQAEKKCSYKESSSDYHPNPMKDMEMLLCFCPIYLYICSWWWCRFITLPLYTFLNQLWIGEEIIDTRCNKLVTEHVVLANKTICVQLFYAHFEWSATFSVSFHGERTQMIVVSQCNPGESLMQELRR